MQSRDSHALLDAIQIHRFLPKPNVPALSTVYRRRIPAIRWRTQLNSGCPSVAGKRGRTIIFRSVNNVCLSVGTSGDWGLAPVAADHDAVDAGANSEHADSVAGLDFATVDGAGER